MGVKGVSRKVNWNASRELRDWACMNVNLRRELGASRALDGRLDVNWRRLEPAALRRTWRNSGATWRRSSNLSKMDCTKLTGIESTFTAL